MEVIVQRRTKQERTALLGAFIGNTLEWFDFWIFGTAAALVFGKLFFPEVDPATALLASFATLWVGFITRPLGGYIFGHFGDRFGRKNVLMATLVLMGSSTFVIGILPTYAQIGVLAPILLALMRALQGLASGGEWSGAVLMASESAPDSRKTIAASWVQQGNAVASLLSTGSFLLVGMLPDDAFFAWGWRLPFLASVVLVVVGIVLRLKMTETDEFLASKNERKEDRAPAILVFTKAPALLVLGILASIMAISFAYFGNTFLLSWTTGPLGIDRQYMLAIITGTSFVTFFTVWLAGQAAQRFGRVPVMLTGLGIMLAVVVPLFTALSVVSVVWITIATYLSYIGASIYTSVLASFLAFAFPVNIRYTGMALAYQLCATTFGGSTALVAQWILNISGNNAWAVAGYYLFLLLATAAGVIGLGRVVRRRASADVGVEARDALGAV
jgi:MFS family permease